MKTDMRSRETFHTTNWEIINLDKAQTQSTVSLHLEWGFPHSSVGKESTCNAEDLGLIPGRGRSAGEGFGYPLQYSWASLVAQLVKNPPAIQETWDWSLGWENSPREGKGYLLQNSHLENSMDFIVHWVTKCQTRPNNFHWALYEKSSISKMHIQLQGMGSKLPLLIRPSLWDLGVKLDPWLCIFPVRVRKSSTECILNAYTIGRALCRRCRWRQEGF